MTAHEIHALSGAYAVDALDDLERARFEAHLAECAECQAEVASLQATAALFSDLTDVAPPASVRDKVLADIKNVRPLPPTVARLEAKIEARRPRRWSSFVAAAAVLGVLGGGFAVWQDQQGSTSQQNTVFSVGQIKNASDVQVASHKLATGGSATVYRSAKLNKAAVVTSGLEAAAPGSVYQLWLQNADGVMEPAGFITGSGKQSEVFDGDGATARAAAISVEPASPRSSSPTGPILTVIPLEQT